MELSKANLQTFLENAPELKLCNDNLFEAFFPELLNLDFQKLDKTSSKIDVSDRNGKLLKYELDKLCKDRVDLSKELAYHIELISLDDKNIKLIFILWKDRENSYVGHIEAQYADDALIKNDEDIREFKEELHLLLFSEVKEKLFFTGNRMKKYVYVFQNNNKKKDLIIFLYIPHF